MSRFTLTSFSTGVVVAGGADFTIDLAVGHNRLDIVKIEIVPSTFGPLGYNFKIFKDTARAQPLFATQDNKLGAFYYPTTRAGGEAKEGPPLPYEDLDGFEQLHITIHNFDASTRGYTVEIVYQEHEYPAYLTGVLTSSINPLTAEQDLAGTSLVLNRNGIWEVTGNFEIDIENGPAESADVIGYLSVDGSLQSRIVRCINTTSNAAIVVTSAQTWYVTITAQPKTIKLRAKKNSGSGVAIIFSEGTNINAVWLGEP